MRRRNETCARIGLQKVRGRSRIVELPNMA